jgi:hypothetical protein
MRNWIKNTMPCDLLYLVSYQNQHWQQCEKWWTHQNQTKVSNKSMFIPKSQVRNIWSYWLLCRRQWQTNITKERITHETQLRTFWYNWLCRQWQKRIRKENVWRDALRFIGFASEPALSLMPTMIDKSKQKSWSKAIPVGNSKWEISDHSWLLCQQWQIKIRMN